MHRSLKIGMSRDLGVSHRNGENALPPCISSGISRALFCRNEEFVIFLNPPLCLKKTRVRPEWSSRSTHGTRTENNLLFSHTLAAQSSRLRTEEAAYRVWLQYRHVSDWREGLNLPQSESEEDR